MPQKMQINDTRRGGKRDIKKEYMMKQAQYNEINAREKQFKPPDGFYSNLILVSKREKERGTDGDTERELKDGFKFLVQ